MIDTLWDFFEITVNFYQGFLLIYFCHTFLGDKHKKKFVSSSGMSAAVILAVVISIVNKIMAFESFLSLLYTAVIFFYCLWELNGTLIRKIFASMYVSLIASISAAIVSNLSTVIFNTNLQAILSERDIKRFTAVILTQIFLFYLVAVSLKLFRKDNKNPELIQSEWIMIISVLVISIAIGALINKGTLNAGNMGGNVIVSVIFILLFLINVIVVLMAVDMSSKNTAIRESEILRIEKEYAYDYIKGLDEEYDLIRKIRHDIKGLLGTINALILDKKYDKASETIITAIESFDNRLIFIHTKNDILNAVVNSKMSNAKSFGIDVQVMAPEEISGIDDLDICRLMSNLLDNAINYCKNDILDHHSIFLKIVNEDQVIVINLKNTISNSILVKNPYLKSKDEHHGLGIGIIRDIAAKYDGICDFYEEENFFCCNVILRRLS